MDNFKRLREAVKKAGERARLLELILNGGM